MIEKPTNADIRTYGNETHEGGIEKRRTLALELYESGEVFPFTGLVEGAYEKLKTDEEGVPEGYVTPIDELIKKFEVEGLKIEKGEAWKEVSTPPSIISVVPALSEGGLYGENLLHIKNIRITPDMDSRLVELIRLSAI